MKRATDIEEYINSLPMLQRERINLLRKLVKELVPEAAEEIAYGMPAYKLNGKRLVYFASFPHHIGFYPLPHALQALKKELINYKQGKGSIKFSLSKPLPIDLIKKIIKKRLAEIEQSEVNGLSPS